MQRNAMVEYNGKRQTIYKRGERKRRRRRVFPLTVFIVVLTIFLVGFLTGRITLSALNPEGLPGLVGSAFKKLAGISQGNEPPAVIPDNRGEGSDIKSILPESDDTVHNIINDSPDLQGQDDFIRVPGEVDDAAPPRVDVSETPKEPDAIAKDSWNLLLVNKDNPLPDGFSVDLTAVGSHQADSRAANALEEMLDGAKAAGLSPIICSSYRSVERQTTLYENKVAYCMGQGNERPEAERLAGTVVAYPGTSEHHTGLAFDIVSLSYQHLEEDQEDTPESVWLRENCHKYGFILRYPKDKTDVTGIIYEPWHYRYVGVEAAAYIMENGICLEEYLDQF